MRPTEFIGSSPRFLGNSGTYTLRHIASSHTRALPAGVADGPCDTMSQICKCML